MPHWWGKRESQYLDNLAGIFQTEAEGCRSGGGGNRCNNMTVKDEMDRDTGSSVFSRGHLGFTGGEAPTEPVT